MITTSGRRRSASATALAPSEASPITRMCGARESERRSPSRTTSWSSTIRHVISRGESLFEEEEASQRFADLGGKGVGGVDVRARERVAQAAAPAESGSRGGLRSRIRGRARPPAPRTGPVSPGRQIRAAGVELLVERDQCSGQSSARCARKCSRVPGRRKSTFAQTPVAPASRAARTTSVQLLGSVRDAREDRCHRDVRLDPGCHELLQRSQPLARVGGGRLGPAPDLLVERRDRERHRHRRVPRRLDEHVDVADDHRPARDDRERVRRLGQHLETCSGQLVAALGGLVRVGRGTDRDRLARATTSARARARSTSATLILTRIDVP